MVHENSLKAYIEEKENGSIGKRHKMILQHLKRYKVGTAREIMEGLGFKEPNQVRPRITDLKKMNLVIETYKTKCLFSGKTVSCFKLK